MKNQRQKAQALLSIIMLLATILSIVITTAFRASTETQLTKLEEEEKKAFAATEAAIEAVLKQGTGEVRINEIGGFDNYRGGAKIENVRSKDFITRLLQKDEQYTIYLSTPQLDQSGNLNFNQLGEPYYSGDLNICFNDSVNNNSALEITLIKQDNSINRYVINPNNKTVVRNGLAASPNNNSTNCPAGNFQDYYRLSSISNTKLLVVRTINSQTKVGFRGTKNLPIEGKTIHSDVTSPGGANKKIVFFQSYPQIPLEFFVTSF